jgi:deoxyhypusine synthase
MSRYPEFDPHFIESHPFGSRESKVNIGMAARPARSGASFAEFLDSLPCLLAGNALRLVANRIAHARRRDRAVVVSCGGHVVKCGLSPVLIGLMERGLITALAINGAVAIHDAELALFGQTSENVDKGLQTGTFGMASETAQFYNHALQCAQQEQLGAGEALGRALWQQKAPCAEISLLAQAYRLGVPVTVHIAVGTDIVHMHPSANGAALGETSLRDFRILTAAMRSLSQGGVLLNLGSAVILPEVLLKAIATLRNQDVHFADFLGVDVDFAVQYRAHQQLVQRVESIGGQGVQLTGHHEILVPLLAFAVLEAWDQSGPQAEDDMP